MVICVLGSTFLCSVERMCYKIDLKLFVLQSAVYACTLTCIHVTPFEPVMVKSNFYSVQVGPLKCLTEILAPLSAIFLGILRICRKTCLLDVLAPCNVLRLYV